MALVPTRTRARHPEPRPPTRLPRAQRRRLADELRQATASLTGEAVLLAGTIADAIAALGSGLWTQAIAAPPMTHGPPPEPLADQLGLTLHRPPTWQIDEARQLVDEELAIRDPRRRERAARLATACAAARRQGANRVIAGTHAEDFLPTALEPAQAERIADRYGLALASPFASRSVRSIADEWDEALHTGRWRQRRWEGWLLREVFADEVSASLAWPMRSTGLRHEG